VKRDGRQLDHKTLEEIQRMSVERVRDGEEPSAVIASCGFCRTTIYKWLNTAKGRGHGLAALRSRKGTGRPRKLTAAQERQVFRWINGKDPRQYGFDFGLWTRQVVAELVVDRFGVKLSLASVGKLLAELGLTPQKPLMRAYERDPAAIEAWKRDIYPSIAARAKRLGRRFISGMNPAFVLMRCKAGPGASRARRRLLRFLASDNRSRQLPRSMPKAPSGLRHTRAG
jgi:transposase